MDNWEAIKFFAPEEIKRELKLNCRISKSDLDYVKHLFTNCTKTPVYSCWPLIAKTKNKVTHQWGHGGVIWKSWMGHVGSHLFCIHLTSQQNQETISLQNFFEIYPQIAQSTTDWKNEKTFIKTSERDIWPWQLGLTCSNSNRFTALCVF